MAHPLANPGSAAGFNAVLSYGRMPGLESCSPLPINTAVNCEAPCLMFKRKYQKISSKYQKISVWAYVNPPPGGGGGVLPPALVRYQYSNRIYLLRIVRLLLFVSQSLLQLSDVRFHWLQEAFSYSLQQHHHSNRHPFHRPVHLWNIFEILSGLRRYFIPGNATGHQVLRTFSSCYCSSSC